MYMYTYVKIKIRQHKHKHTRAYTRTQARGATPELRRVADTTSHGLSAGRYSTQTTINNLLVPVPVCSLVLVLVLYEYI